ECGAYHDRDNRVGISPRGARDNASEPPVIGPHVSLAVSTPGRNLAEDYRDAVGAGQSWRLTVETDQSSPVTLSWREAGRSGGWRYQVFDVTAGRALEPAGSYAFQPEPGRPREFVVLAGSAEYIAAEAGSAGLVPGVTELLQNRPNPFAGSTTISYQLAAAGRVSLKLYNVTGQLVRVLEDGPRPAGRYALRWDGSDGAGRALPNGLYFYRLEAPGLTATRKLTLVR
ncbi:MAG: T9SS type A sorting domain-containing protein, partial [Candidatus Edwardsbacteria bacterium]|nr:T9SS type A sorting domain-containing protein [Candidatus Edwardsbacteria bacterium]